MESDNRWWRELGALLADEESDIREKYAELYRILNSFMNEVTERTGLTFSGPFARLVYLMREYGIDHELYTRVNSFRSMCKGLGGCDTEQLRRHLLSDVRDVGDLICGVRGTDMPEELRGILPTEVHRWKHSQTRTKYMRVAVTEWDERYITATTEDGDGEAIKIDYTDSGNFFGDWSYIRALIKEGTQLNIILPVVKGDVYVPQLIILEPDYLIDISSLAACFEDYGASPFNYLLNRFLPSKDNYWSLLGDLAGRMLDEEVNYPLQRTYADSVNGFFQKKALSIVTNMMNSEKFHTEAKEQQQNIRAIIRTAKESDSNFDTEKLILEPSFFCEMLGIQGRMDLLHTEYKLMMEQKSGARNVFTNGHKETHYVQMLLYLALLHYSFELRNEDISCYLLYSKYVDGLLKEGPAPKLLFEALKLRNQVTWNEYYLGQGGIRMLEKLTPERINVKGMNTERYTSFSFNNIVKALNTIQKAEPLMKDYFYRMFTFLKREHILTKVGTSRREASGLASLWNSTEEEKRQAGSILDRLRISFERQEEKSDGGGDELADASHLTLLMPDYEDDYVPNFRVGEAVILYKYNTNEVADARKGIVFRSSIEKLGDKKITIKLRSEQSNRSVFDTHEDEAWAMEHDFMETTYSALYRGLYAFINANEDRRKLILAQRDAERDESVKLNGEYGNFNALVLGAKQAKDYFLVIGPPGTGKTSFGMLNILKETLTEEGKNVIILSFTNRAVDEVCSKLVKEGIDFIRIGSDSSCPEAYKEYMLEQKIAGCRNMASIREKLERTRVYVGTTTSMSSKLDLFTIKQFDLAIIDEASQILEPHLLPLLSAKHGEENAIRRFVLIGDHKQLPAVVQQSAKDAEVTEESLKAIHLYNCRNSLFERLLSIHEADSSHFVFRLTRQGRMHRDVALFSSDNFYERKLMTVPLEHQEVDIDFAEYDSDDRRESLLATRRSAFIDVVPEVHSVSSKVNKHEAEVIAGIVVAAWNLYRKNGREFMAEESVGVIVPYRNQIALVRKEIAKYGIDELRDITIDTVERYQGSERDIIVYGFTVRYEYQLDFLTDNVFVENGATIDRKLNVALTRAREHNIIVGNKALLERNEVFRQLIRHNSATENA